MDKKERLIDELVSLLEGALPTLRAHVGYHTDREYVLRVVDALERWRALSKDSKTKGER